MTGFYPTILKCPELGPDIYLTEQVLHFCERDGSDVAVADISIVRRRLAGNEDGNVATSGSSHSVQIKGCTLEKLLGAEGRGRIGEKTHVPMHA